MISRIKKTTRERKSSVQSAPRRSAEALARSFSRIRGPQVTMPERGFEEERRDQQLLRRRAEISRGKRQVETEEEEESEHDDMDMDMEFQPEDEDVQKMGKRYKKKTSQKKLFAILQSMGFIGTCYPHRETMQKLGICRDVDYLFEICGLAGFMSLKSDAYKDETCEFLATLDFYFHDEEKRSLIKKEGAGYLTFSIRNENFRITMKQIDRLFGFPKGESMPPDFDKGELSELWHTIAGPEIYSSSRSKSAQIRSPSFRYLHKALANTFFARRVTGNINDGEMQLLAIALKEILVYLPSGSEIQGDKAGTGLTIIFINQLLSYKEWALRSHTLGSKNDICIGGIVTPILNACNVELRSEPVGPRLMDVKYLVQNKYLARRKKDERLIYLFTHPDVGEAQIELPCTEITTIRMGENINFRPPIELLYDPSAPEPVQQIQENPPTDDDSEPDRQYFDEPANRCKTLKEAHKRIGILQKWCKWQDKAVNALKKSVKELTSGMKEMKDQIANLPTRRRDSPSDHGDEEPTAFHRSRSFHVEPTQDKTSDPPRASAVELKQYKRRVRKQSGVDSGSSIDHHSVMSINTEPQWGSSSNTINPSTTTYTQESMEAFIEALLKDL